ncbi:MAG: hypothetical protein A2231_09420 [Candidatus Firestonebacteria bacterium RIFOXYA2_FULL_40_8]|nr:MAG: hypothetical protein A2231_09420 [Candidatus Firestonebacteria bacterium RIFOXYA2_FULL_40_8]
MKKFLLVCLSLLLSGSIVSAKDVSATKSMRALRNDNFNEGQLGTLEIQMNVGKCFLSEFQKNKPVEPPADAAKRGYYIFLRNYLFDITPFTNPTAQEMAKKEIKIFATPGEYEPIVFGVQALANLSGIKIIVSDFVNEKNEKIPSAAFQVNNVEYRPLGMESVVVTSWVCQKVKDIPKLEEGLAKQIWIDVKIPEEAKEGVYKGKVSFAPANKPAYDIPVEIKVFPYKLLQPPIDVMTWAPIMAGTWDFEQLEKEFIAIKEHGMTGEITGSLASEGGNFTKANKYMELAKKAGLPGKFVDFSMHCQGTSRYDTTYGFGGARGDQLWSQATYNKLTEAVEATKKNADANKWLPFSIYLTTELGSTNADPNKGYEKTIKGSLEYYKAARKVPGISLMATFNRQEQLTQCWDLPTLDEFGFNGEMFPDWEKGAKKKPSWMTFVSVNDRLGYGLYLWKYRITACRPWCLFNSELVRDETCLLYYYNKEEHPVVRFKRIREAVDDYKYMYTLSETVKQAKAKGKDTKAAELVMQKITDKIPHDHKKDTPGFDYTKMDDMRFELGQEIVKLLK